MKNLTVIFFAIATLFNLVIGLGANVHKYSQNTALEKQNFILNAFKGEISFEPIKALFASKKNQRRDFASGFGKKNKDNLISQNISPFSVFYDVKFDTSLPIFPNKIAPKLSLLKSEFSNTTFLI